MSDTISRWAVVTAALATSWNSRFGYYAPGAKRGALPDRSGYGYTDYNWGTPTGPGGTAYDGESGKDASLPSYSDDVDGAYTNFLGYQGDALAGINTRPPAGSYLTTEELRDANPRNRRLVITPVVDCGIWNAGGSPTIKDWACVFMLAPIGQANNDFLPQIEFLGLASKPGSPCTSIGLPGGSIGPLVPALVQ